MTWYNAKEASKLLNHKNVGGTNLLRVLKNEMVNQHPDYSKMFKKVDKAYKTRKDFGAIAKVLLMNELGLEFVKKLLNEKYPEGIEPKSKKTITEWER